MAPETTTIKLDGRFEGWQAEMVADPEWGYLEALQSSDASRIAQAVADCLHSWNFKDRKGETVPPTAEGVRRVQRGALIQLMDKYSDQYRALPNG